MLVYCTVEKQRESRDRLQNKKNIHCTRETNTIQEKQELGLYVTRQLFVYHVRFNQSRIT